MNNIKDMIGLKFGRLTVVNRSKDYISPSGKHRIKWHCLCECGNEVDVLGHLLRNGHTKSCGCLFKENLQKVYIASRKHFGCMYCGSDKHYAKGYCKKCYMKARRGTLK